MLSKKTMKSLGAISSLILLLLINAAEGLADSQLCRAQCAGENEQEPCVFKFSIDIYSSSTGYYQVEGCPGVQPTLGMVEGVNYKFIQTNNTNWFHPLGFAYGPDGVYLVEEELEKGVTDPNGEIQNCTDSLSCQHAQYQLNGQNLCDNSPCDPEDFGLDQYEGVFFSGGRDDWIDAGNFTVDVKIIDPGTVELFYFCHIHKGMSGRIKVLDPVTFTQKNPANIKQIPYSYEVVNNEFDAQCGTFNASQFQNTDKSCPEMSFFCSDNLGQYEKCLAAINCGMHQEMRTSGGTDPTVTFIHQMIAHHRNAVQMAKVLLKESPPSLKCGTSYDGRRLEEDGELHEFCHDTDDAGGTPLITMLWEIINTQNAQITLMESWLEDNQQPSHDYCDHNSTTTSVVIIVSVCALLIVAMVTFGACFWVRSVRKKQSDVETPVKTMPTSSSTSSSSAQVPETSSDSPAVW